MENILRKIKTYPLGTSAQDMTTRLKWRRQYLKDLYEALKLKLASKENDHKMRSLLLMARAINRFHVTSRLSKIQNKGATKVIFLIRHKKRYIYSVCNFTAQ